MEFSEKTKDEVYSRSGGRCECMEEHGEQAGSKHEGRCSNTFARNSKWYAHPKNSEGKDISANCEALCVACHGETNCDHCSDLPDKYYY